MHFVQQVMEDRKTSQGAAKMDYLKAMNVENCLNGGFNFCKACRLAKENWKTFYRCCRGRKDLITKRITVASLVHKCQLVVSVQK